MITRLTFDQIITAVHDAYEACKDIKGGQNAHYIPYLANINPSLFGISLCLPDGRLISVGDTDYRFGIESVSKVHTAILALEQHGAQAILDDIGADATGLPFNSIFAILLENDRPSTPLVNAGAIAACSLVKPHGGDGVLEGHLRQHDRSFGKQAPTHRRAVPFRIRHELRQPLHHVAAARVRPHVR